MKKTLSLFIFTLIISCAKPSDCVESTGAIIAKEVSVAGFTKIKVYKGISVVITQGLSQKVVIETGENLLHNIDISVSDNTLIVKDNTTCNWVRAYGQTTIYITAPNLTDIVSKTEKTISNNGVLTYPNLRLESMDLSDGAGTGDFNLQINNTNLTIDNNNVANYHIWGQTTNFYANFYEGDGRIEAPDFTAQNITVFHRGSNDMILKPMAKIEGNIYSTGNIICKNHPAIVSINTHYIGQLIFN